MKKVWIEISKSAVIKNLKVLRAKLKKGVQIFAVVKSNAYGHGIHTFSVLADKAGVDGFCVDSVIEGATLRREGIKKPILVLGPTLPSLYAQAVRADIVLTISNWDALRALVRESAKLKKYPKVHLKIDTGMYRQGFYVSQLPEVVAYIKKHQVKLVGVYSHFADSAELESASFTEQQFELFMGAVSYLRQSGFTELTEHIANSAAALTHEAYQLDAIRAGNALYGVYPSHSYEERAYRTLQLAPVLSWHALISEVKQVPAGGAIGYGRTKIAEREMTIALVPIGFWHGIPWELSNNGFLLVDGKRAPIIGRVSMDMVALDVSGLRCKVGSRATIIGEQGGERITAREVANWAHTRPQEIITRINPLIERVIGR